MKKYVIIIFIIILAFLFTAIKYKDLKYQYFLEGMRTGMGISNLFFQRYYAMSNEVEKEEIIKNYIKCEYEMTQSRIEEGDIY
jgi:hypothetical protein